MTPVPVLSSTLTADQLRLSPAGAWTAAHSQALEELVDAATPQAAHAKAISIDMAGVEELDTLGAWLLERLLRSSNIAAPNAQFIGLPSHYRGLIDEIHQVNLHNPPSPAKPNRLLVALDGVGRATAQLGTDAAAFLDMCGQIG